MKQTLAAPDLRATDEVTCETLLGAIAPPRGGYQDAKNQTMLLASISPRPHCRGERSFSPPPQSTGEGRKKNLQPIHGIDPADQFLQRIQVEILVPHIRDLAED